jgi:fimbrial isopeptide formation D2 family protein
VNVTPLRAEKIEKGVMLLTDSAWGTEITTQNTHDSFNYRVSVKIPANDGDDEPLTSILIVDPIDGCLEIGAPVQAVVAEGGVSGLPSPTISGNTISLNITGAAILSALRGKTIVFITQVKIRDELAATDVFAAHTATSGKIPNKAYAVINGEEGGGFIAPDPVLGEAPGNPVGGPVYLESNAVYAIPPVEIFKLVNGVASGFAKRA